MEGERERETHPMSFLDSTYSTAADLDCSFTSTASTSSFATTFASSASASARSSLSLPSFSSATSLINPLPHSKSNCSPHWSAVRAAANLSRDGTLHLRHLHLLRHLGSGHIARVFHCRLKGSDNFDFALKVVDLDAIKDPDAKLSQVRTEARVLAALDHPFLPTLYARMDASHYACFLIDYCPGGDLHSLLVRHPGHRLPLPAVRFFAAEILLALEYLHALGFVYRDLKPENVLIRSDGHIMLSDFDLCFSDDNLTPRLHRRPTPGTTKPCRQQHRSCSSWVEEEEDKEEELEVVAEPEQAFSRACVGTHEYVAPEIVSGAGHGSGVDWWAFGVFVYELIYGRTPFRGSSKEATLKNIKNTKRELSFPDSREGKDNDCDEDDEMIPARDLIRRLLVREPKERMGSRRGAAEIKKHPFFHGVKWSLVRCAKPPVAVGPAGAVIVKDGGLRRRRGRRSAAAAGRWWSRMAKWRSSCCSTAGSGGKSVVSGKKGIKLELMGSKYNNYGHSSKSNRKATKERGRKQDFFFLNECFCDFVLYKDELS